MTAGTVDDVTCYDLIKKTRVSPLSTLEFRDRNHVADPGEAAAHDRGTCAAGYQQSP